MPTSSSPIDASISGRAASKGLRLRAVKDDGRMLQVARLLGLPRSTVWTIRIEVEALLTRLRRMMSFSARRELAALRRQRHLLLNVASGPFVIPGFVNLELRPYHASIVRWDCRRALPVADASCAGIRIEHFVEHLDPRDELPQLLAACWRALQPGGILRIVVPDTARYLRAYLDDDRAAFERLSVPNPLPDDLPTPLDVVNHVFHQWHEHRWAYDLPSLEWRLRAAGFEDVRRMSYRESRLPALGEDREEHAAYSLYVDAVKNEGTR